MLFTYDTTICIRNIIPIASDIMIKAQDTMTFTYDILVGICSAQSENRYDSGIVPA